MTTPAFDDLVARVRRGDPAAAEELVRLHEPEVRRVVRARLRRSRSRALLDSVDIAQSVLYRFFHRAQAGEFDLDEPDALVKILVTMARNRLADHERRNRAIKRDVGRQVPMEAGSVRIDPAASDPSPSTLAAGRELFDEFRERLEERERYLADQRAAGRSWQSLAEELGESPDSLRMRLSRAVDRVTNELEG